MTKSTIYASLKTINLPLSLFLEWNTGTDQFITVQNWLEAQFDDMPTLTDDAAFVEMCVDYVGLRFEAALADPDGTFLSI